MILVTSCAIPVILLQLLLLSTLLWVIVIDLGHFSRALFPKMKRSWQLLGLLILAVISVTSVGFWQVNNYSAIRLENLSPWSSAPQACYEQHHDVYNVFHNQAHQEFWKNLTENQYKNLQSEWKTFVKHIPARPVTNENQTKERGVVYTCSSGILKPTLISILMLRKTGCKLPIEVWHHGAELKEKDIKLLETVSNITIRDLKLVNDSRFAFESRPEGDKMFEMKGASILYSKFEQVLFLDGDVNRILN